MKHCAFPFSIRVDMVFSSPSGWSSLLSVGITFLIFTFLRSFFFFELHSQLCFSRSLYLLFTSCSSVSSGLASRQVRTNCDGVCICVCIAVMCILTQTQCTNLTFDEGWHPVEMSEYMLCFSL